MSDLNHHYANSHFQTLFTCTVIWFSPIFGCHQQSESVTENGPVILKVPEEFVDIQSAIDASNPGDKIILEDGYYYENLEINNKKDLIICGLQKTDAIINGSGYVAINIRGSENISIESLSIVNSSDGISMEGHLTVNDVLFQNNEDGIDVESGTVKILNSIFLDHQDDAIDLDFDSNALIDNNLISRSNDDGIEVRFHPLQSQNNEITIDIRNNIISNSKGDGVQFIDYEVATNRKILVRNNLIINSSYNGLSTNDNRNTLPTDSNGSIDEHINISNNTLAYNNIGINASGENLASFNNIYINNITQPYKTTNLSAYTNSAIHSTEDQIISDSLFQGNTYLDQCYQPTKKSADNIPLSLEYLIVNGVKFDSIIKPKTNEFIGFNRAMISGNLFNCW